MNNIPSIKTSDNPPSQAIMNVMSQQTNTTAANLGAGSSINTEGTNTRNTEQEERETARGHGRYIGKARANITQESETTRILHETLITQGKRKYQTTGDDLEVML